MTVKTDGMNKEDIKALSELHSTLLPESAVSRLGRYFMTKFYYSVLVQKGLLSAYLYKISGVQAGFIACTDHPFELMKLGAKSSFFKLLTVLTVSVLAKPSRLFILLKMLTEKFPADAQKKLKNSGQFMSFGVMEEYRKHIDESTGKTIPQVLMDKVFEHFKQSGKSSFFLLVIKSNERAVSFYKKYDCEILNEKFGSSLIIKFGTGNE